MERISENLFNKFFSANYTGENPIVNGIFFGTSPLYLSNQKLDPATVTIGSGGTNSILDDEPQETFMVSKSTDAKKIAENLLRENFEFAVLKLNLINSFK